MKLLNIGFIGAKHTHYADFSGYVKESPFCRIAGVWDEDGEKAAKWAAQIGTFSTASYEDILSDPKVDGVVIASTPHQHEEHIIAAAKAGKAIYVEQPLAISVEAANRIRDAVKEAGVPFVLSNPVKRSNYLFAKNLVDSGLMGEILHMRVRTLHDNSVLMVEGKFPEFEYVYDKSQSGGGAMNNMGCHGVKLLRWFLGMPESAFGMYSSFTEPGKKNDIEENAVVVFKFKGGAIGTIETGWVHPRYQGGFEIHGTQGSIVSTYEGLSYRLNCRGGDWVKVSPKLMPGAMSHPMTYWIENLYKGTAMDEFGIDEAVDLVIMTCAAYDSQGKEVKL